MIETETHNNREYKFEMFSNKMWVDGVYTMKRAKDFWNKDHIPKLTKIVANFPRPDNFPPMSMKHMTHENFKWEFVE